MSVDREYTVRIPTDAEDSGAQRTAQDLEETGAVEKNANEDLNAFQTPGRELNALIGELSDLLAGTSLLLRTAFDSQNSGAIEIPSANKGTNAGSQSAPPPEVAINRGDAKSFADEPTTAVEQSVATGDKGSHQHIEADATIMHTTARQAGESVIDAQTRMDLMNHVRSLQTVAPSHDAGLTQQDAAELAELMRQLGKAFSEQHNHNLSRQEFEREKIALRRLIESKGK
jgi:hypothetical protein